MCYGNIYSLLKYYWINNWYWWCKFYAFCENYRQLTSIKMSMSIAQWLVSQVSLLLAAVEGLWWSMRASKFS